jgi:hypothetical protein
MESSNLFFESSGMIFNTSDELALQLQKLCDLSSMSLDILRTGAANTIGWDENWNAVMVPVMDSLG